MRRVPLNQPNSAIHRERDLSALSRLMLLLFCGLVLAGGFVFAAGQHFAAVRYGYRSEELRRERASLLEEQRRLLLEREEVAAPARLENAARDLGMQTLRPEQLDASGSTRSISASRSAPAFVNPSASLAR
jgi:cell division protein FtsL